MMFDPIALDREIARIARDAHDWHEALAEEPEEAHDPFVRHRPKLTRTQFSELAEVPEDDPLRQPFLRWTYALMEQRINAPWYQRAAMLRYGQRYPLPEGGGDDTLSGVARQLLASSGRRVAWWHQLEEHARELSDAEGRLWRRRQAIAEELELPSPDQFELPTPDIVAVAEGVLLELQPLLDEFTGGLESYVDASLGRDKMSVLPARLNEAQLAHWFREARLLEDLRLRPWNLPGRVGPASFMRALDELGREFCYAAAPTTQPFVIAHDPHRLADWTHGACFASLLLNGAFLERNLDLPRNNQRDLRRNFAIITLLEWARRALKVTLRPLALTSTAAATEAFREEMSRLCGITASEKTTFVFLRLHPTDPQRFAAMSLGFDRANELVGKHDEDWFRNPRAVEQVRSEAQLSPVVHVEADDLRAANSALIQLLSSAL